MRLIPARPQGPHHGRGKYSPVQRQCQCQCQITGTLTAQVVQKLPNGNLVIQGSKELTLNQGNELIQVQGIIRTADIGPDNTIAGTRVADARMVYGGRGPIARSNAMGWLDRFFNGAWFPN